MKQWQADDLFKRLSRDYVAQLSRPASKTVSALSKIDIAPAIPQVYNA